MGGDHQPGFTAIAEERFRPEPPFDADLVALLVDEAQDYAILTLDSGGRVASWNRGAQRIKGYSAAQILGRHFSVFYEQSDRAAELPRWMLAQAREQGRVEHEGWRVRRDGSRFWANVVLTALRDPDGTLRGYGKVTRDLTERHLADLQLRASEERLRLMVDGVEDYAILLLSPDGRIVTWNTGAERIKGYSAEEIIGAHFSVFYGPDDRSAGLPERLLVQARAQRHVEHEGWRIRKDGSRFWANVVLTALYHEDGTLRGYGKVTRDLTERYLSELELRASEERFRIAFEHAAVPISTVSLEEDTFGELLSVNPAYGEMLGRPAQELVGLDLTALVHPDDLELGLAAPLRRLARGETQLLQFERRYVRADGVIVSTLVSDAVFTDERGRRVALGQILDISERKRFEQQLLHLADHDALTGLFNRRRFEFELKRLLEYVQRFGGGGAVLCLDLDGFKHVNDSLGHAAGDELMTRLAEAAKRSLRQTDVIARTGGDELAVILPNADEARAVVVAEKLLAAVRLAGTVQQPDRHAHVTTSIGIAMFVADEGLESQDLLVEADIAMYDAKHDGRDRYRIYRRGEQRREPIATGQDWLTRLKTGLTEDRFVLFAQPIVAICAAALPRWELLLRLRDGDNDLIAPGAFLYNAERFGLIQDIDRWVMGRSVRLLHEHHQAGNDIGLAFNISARTLNAGTVAEELAALLERYPVPRDRLTVEITETAAIGNIEQARELARDIRGLGCKLSLDDFGAGFATFYYLKHLEFDYVKIDGEFISHLPDNHADRLVVAAVVDIARGLGADTIAEFVQDDRTIQLLRKLGVGYGQGYHLGRPGPAEPQLPQRAPSSPDRRV
jgi:diguanylate cyclase (GGDEF)-like protein/PAS domain S-box-containing protein